MSKKINKIFDALYPFFFISIIVIFYLVLMFVIVVIGQHALTSDEIPLAVSIILLVYSFVGFASIAYSIYMVVEYALKIGRTKKEE